MDVKTAFLHSTLEETVYIQQPTGYEEGDKVCKLQKALYGLKQSPRVWYNTLHDYFKSLGYQRTNADHSVFLHSNKTIVAVYVDDLLIFGPDMSVIQELKAQLRQKFDMTDLGPCSHYLGMEITRDRVKGTLRMAQTTYLDKVLCAFNMADCKPVSTPMDQGLKLVKETEKTAAPEDVRRFQSAIGSLMYAMIETRPDIAFAVSTLSQFASNPNEEHWKALKHVFRYLKGTMSLGITYGGDGSLVGYTDSDWAGDAATRKSTSGYLFKLANGAISWSSKRQPTVALSSCEAEYMAMTQGVKEAVWLRGLLHELGYEMPDTDTVRLYGDNMGSLALAQNPEFHTRSKHIGVQWHFVREKIQDHTVAVEYLKTEDMVADGLTKALGKTKFESFVKLMGMTTQ